ncbi:hypothetical protein OQH61_00385 [Helicobacter sp. MIT 21-1697]|uniref:hypothetical protein n=1 Tax=Helicobacter sp. MIT 21-1697 TaxID=2993733 RepID=UPI00224AC1A8|nr:hypothetical protein [Helicobacter sp. MIT 21-1697]MCX2716198.1 hypothetical protein [Helicobacter sp. MIT 21-1697]
MSKKLMAKCLVGVLMFCAMFDITLANDVKIPTCVEAADSMSDYGESGDCLYQYSQVKTFSVDKTSGVVTCKAVMRRKCPDMPEENTTGEVVKFTAKYGIVAII